MAGELGQVARPLQAHTADLDEALALVSSVYCSHRLQLAAHQRQVNTRLCVAPAYGSSLVSLAYGAEVAVDAGNFDGIFLVMKCVSGWGTVEQAGECRRWEKGDILPVSMNRPTRFHFNGEFEQISLRPDRERLQALCAQWIGHALDEDLCFALRPFSHTLSAGWDGMLGLLGSGTLPLSTAACQSLDDAMLSMLLAGHTHNYSAAMQAPVQQPHSRLVRRFEALLQAELEPHWSVADVAARLGVSIRSLQTAVQRELATTPGAYLRDLRLAQVRSELEAGEPVQTVAACAYAHGFLHLGRFAQLYQARFGERPSDTLRRARRH